MNYEEFVKAMQEIVASAHNDHHLATNWATDRIEAALQKYLVTETKPEAEAPGQE